MKIFAFSLFVIIFQTAKPVMTSNVLGVFFREDKPQPLPTDILRSFIKDTKYTNDQYPPNNGQGTNVGVTLFVQKLGSISEATASYAVELYVFLTWRDPRLDYSNLTNIDTTRFFQLSRMDDQSSLWQPPVFFSNTQGATKPAVLTDNSQILLLPDGSVMLHTRVQANADCPMNLINYPFDTQECSIYTAVFGYFDYQVKLSWATPDIYLRPPDTANALPLEVNPSIVLANFEISNQSYGISQTSSTWTVGCSQYRTCLKASFQLKRKILYHMFNTFLPTGLIVILSWLSFWVNPENVPARVALAITTFLTLQTAGTNIRAGLPTVSYLRAVDIWLFFCQAIVFFTLLEFVIVHSVRRRKPTSDTDRNWIFKLLQTGNPSKKSQTASVRPVMEYESAADENYKPIDNSEIHPASIIIDKVARGLFPGTFTLFSIIYFAKYYSA